MKRGVGFGRVRRPELRPARKPRSAVGQKVHAGRVSCPSIRRHDRNPRESLSRLSTLRRGWTSLASVSFTNLAGFLEDLRHPWVIREHPDGTSPILAVLGRRSIQLALELRQLKFQLSNTFFQRSTRHRNSPAPKDYVVPLVLLHDAAIRQTRFRPSAREGSHWARVRIIGDGHQETGQWPPATVRRSQRRYAMQYMACVPRCAKVAAPCYRPWPRSRSSSTLALDADGTVAAFDRPPRQSVTRVRGTATALM